MMRTLICLAGLGFLALTPGRPAALTKPEGRMHQAAGAFLGALNTEQREKALLPFNSDERFNWHYIPRQRKGLPLKAMTDPQRKQALELLKVGLSAKGMEKVRQIQELENVLQEIEKGTGPVRDPELYYVTLFGEPSEKGTWGWRYEGHHLSLNWTIIKGKVIASSPQFLGTNPAEVRVGALKGRRVLAKEEDLGWELARSLTSEQRAEAILSPTAPPDIITEAKRQADIAESRGIAYDKLTRDQQGVLLALVQEYATVQNPAIAKQRLDAVRKAGLDKLRFAWMGGLEKGTGNYYRVQGTTFLIEYDNTQNNANHIHCVWRDFKGDFGVDLLAQHYQRMAHKGGKHIPNEDHDHDHDHPH